MEDRQTLRRATELWRQGYRYQAGGNVDRAIELYRQSIELYPTAEAHTFLGWAMSFQGHLTEATEECLRAIEIDSEFGNPYNDIGVYLMQQGQAGRVNLMARKGQAGQTLRTAPVPLPESGADLHPSGTLVGGAPRVRGGCAAGSA